MSILHETCSWLNAKEKKAAIFFIITFQVKGYRQALLHFLPSWRHRLWHRRLSRLENPGKISQFFLHSIPSAAHSKRQTHPFSQCSKFFRHSMRSFRISNFLWMSFISSFRLSVVHLFLAEQHFFSHLLKYFSGEAKSSTLKMQTPKASTNAVLFAISLALSIYQRSKPDFRLSDKKRKKLCIYTILKII